jgi:hypothetical protein
MANMGLKEEVQEIEQELEKEQKKPPEQRRGLVDIISEKFVSRKLLVWITGTVLLCVGKVTPEEWTAVTLGYVGIEGFADMVVKYKSASK